MSLCAFNKGEYCSILKEKDCYRCSFRKTEEQIEEGRLKAKERIDSLPTEDRNWIIDKYHRQESSRKGKRNE